MHKYPQWVLAAFITLTILFILLIAQVFLGMPKELLIVLGGTFLLWTVVYWFISRQKTLTPMKHIMRWLLPWMAVMFLFLGAVYYVDRAGWLWFRVTGYDVTLAENLSADVTISPAEFVTAHPQFELDENSLRLPPGDHFFKETVIIPQDSELTIDPGAVLRFGAARSLISYSPVNAKGTKDQPILFTARNPWLKWGVIGVVGSSKPSTFEHIKVEHSRQALVNGVDFFAGLSLIETDGVVRSSIFERNFGKDAVNARLSNVQIQNNEFRNAQKDCLDLDGGSGEISGNLFVNCLDEGIDLSDNKDVEVFDNTILDARGGRLEAEQNQESIIEKNTLGYSD
ncbi:MAG: right-handed parallel beta-helix repeat-containing protein [Candidatus Promineifilaceae bacterium]|nr:right-handed parallel beta-helix repeat-containing protein [Candidatus Promineifilaceae bacterium]